MSIRLQSVCICSKAITHRKRKKRRVTQRKRKRPPDCAETTDSTHKMAPPEQRPGQMAADASGHCPALQGPSTAVTTVCEAQCPTNGSWSSHSTASQSQLALPVNGVRIVVPSTVPAFPSNQEDCPEANQPSKCAPHIPLHPASSPSSLAPYSAASSCSAGSLGSILATTNSTGDGSGSSKSRIFPSTRFFIALLLCLCYVSLSISTSNISVSMVCMIKGRRNEEQQVMSPLESAIDAKEREKSDVFLLLRRRRSTNETANSNGTLPTTVHARECDNLRVRKHVQFVEAGNGSSREKRLTVQVESCHEAEKLAWSSTDQGIVFAAQNAGSLLMLFTGAQADRLNSKWTITGALALLVLSNAILPMVAPVSVWLVVAARVLTGLSDALLQPSTSSLITRWFPPKERPFAIGLITGGRQIGTLLILPLAGFLCTRQDIVGGWPAIFYLSALSGSAILLIWLLMSADKPSKHFCTSRRERSFVEQKIAEERLRKRTERRKIPWRRLATCGPLHVGVAALICHEYPLVIMLQLLPMYINDVLHLSNITNGIVSALPIAVLFLSKTLSASASSYIQARKKGRFLIGRTTLVKWFNGIASLGLGICVGIVPLLHGKNQIVEAIVVLCLANAFAGLHTPGVQTALLQIAPAYTGIITGFAFGCVAIFGILNKILSNFIVQSRTLHEWTIVFWIAAVIAILPVFFFTIWGSAERQSWASTRRQSSRKMKSNNKVFLSDGNQKDIEQSANAPNSGRKDDDEDADSGDFEPEAAVASALRLQMFLEHPELEEGHRMDARFFPLERAKRQMPPPGMQCQQYCCQPMMPQQQQQMGPPPPPPMQCQQYCCTPMIPQQQQLPPPPPPQNFMPQPQPCICTPMMPAQDPCCQMSPQMGPPPPQFGPPPPMQTSCTCITITIQQKPQDICSCAAPPLGGQQFPPMMGPQMAPPPPQPMPCICTPIQQDPCCPPQMPPPMMGPPPSPYGMDQQFGQGPPQGQPMCICTPIQQDPCCFGPQISGPPMPPPPQPMMAPPMGGPQGGGQPVCICTPIQQDPCCMPPAPPPPPPQPIGPQNSGVMPALTISCVCSPVRPGAMQDPCCMPPQSPQQFAPQMAPPMAPPPGQGQGQPVCICTPVQQDPCCPPPQQLPAAPMLPPPPFPPGQQPQMAPPMGGMGGGGNGMPPPPPRPFPPQGPQGFGGLSQQQQQFQPSGGAPPFRPPMPPMNAPPGPGGPQRQTTCICVPAGRGGPQMGAPQPPPPPMPLGQMPPCCAAAKKKQRKKRSIQMRTMLFH